MGGGRSREWGSDVEMKCAVWDSRSTGTAGPTSQQRRVDIVVFGVIGGDKTDHKPTDGESRVERSGNDSDLELANR